MRNPRGVQAGLNCDDGLLRTPAVAAAAASAHVKVPVSVAAGTRHERAGGVREVKVVAGDPSSARQSSHFAPPPAARNEVRERARKAGARAQWTGAKRLSLACSPSKRFQEFQRDPHVRSRCALNERASAGDTAARRRRCGLVAVPRSPTSPDVPAEHRSEPAFAGD